MPDDYNINITSMRSAMVERSEELQSRKTRQLFDWWRSFDERPPLRAQFDVLDHANMMGHLFLIEVMGPSDFRFSLNGEEVDLILGHTSKGDIVSTDTPQSPMIGRQTVKRVALAAYYRTIVEHRSCRMCQGDLSEAHNGNLHFESIDCPLRGEDGGITHIVGVIDSLGHLADRS